MFTQARAIIDRGKRIPGIQGQAFKALDVFLRRMGISDVMSAQDREILASHLEIYALAQKFGSHGIIDSLRRMPATAYEPKFCSWSARDATRSSGGLASQSESAAATAALAEALERHLWFTTDDYFKNPVRSTAQLLPNALQLSRFATIHAQDRHDTTEFLWIEGYSETSAEVMRIPAQIVSYAFAHATHEPLLRNPITTGLATGVTHEDAVLAGALEIIERDAYMLTWLNQCTPLRITLESFSLPSLLTLIKECAQLRLTLDFVRLWTDAPTYVIAAIVRDPHHNPAFSIGMCASANADRAAEKALLEALRGRINTRRRARQFPHARTTHPSSIERWERQVYWTETSRLHHLDFLTQGERRDLEKGVWDSESHSLHWDRILHWMRARNYACITVPLTMSRMNVSTWHCVFVVIPELIPMHLSERKFEAFLTHRNKIARAHGLAPLPEPFLAHPHPFV